MLLQVSRQANNFTFDLIYRRIVPIEFEAARGHKMERENYILSLKEMTKNLYLPEESEISNGNSKTVSTQTNPGIWLETKVSRKRRHPVAVSDVAAVKGTICVDGSNLISDGSGRYFMQVELKDVRPLRNMSNPHSNGQGHSNHRFFPPSRGANGPHNSDRNSQAFYSNRGMSHRSNNYRSNGPNPNGTYFSNQTPYSRDRSYGMRPKFYNDQSDPFQN